MHNPVDIRFENHGSLWLTWPQTPLAEEWIAEHTDGMRFGDALVVEPRYVRDLVEGTRADGLRVTG